ncbi:hypothetical protein AcV7_000030 [Taiwanofungus camphoratus]|nr:hypothetical protein AcV7_000030 [Antrodia cinnamomea]
MPLYIDVNVIIVIIGKVLKGELKWTRHSTPPSTIMSASHIEDLSVSASRSARTRSTVRRELASFSSKQSLKADAGSKRPPLSPGGSSQGEEERTATLWKKRQMEQKENERRVQEAVETVMKRNSVAPSPQGSLSLDQVFDFRAYSPSAPEQVGDKMPSPSLQLPESQEPVSDHGSSDEEGILWILDSLVNLNLSSDARQYPSSLWINPWEQSDGGESPPPLLWDDHLGPLFGLDQIGMKDASVRLMNKDRTIFVAVHRFVSPTLRDELMGKALRSIAGIEGPAFDIHPLARFSPWVIATIPKAYDLQRFLTCPGLLNIRRKVLVVLHPVKRTPYTKRWVTIMSCEPEDEKGVKKSIKQKYAQPESGAISFKKVRTAWKEAANSGNTVRKDLIVALTIEAESTSRNARAETREMAKRFASIGNHGTLIVNGHTYVIHKAPFCTCCHADGHGSESCWWKSDHLQEMYGISALSAWNYQAAAGGNRNRMQ